mgnify:CR=1 FL=1
MKQIDLTSKVVLVTGATRGIGRAIAIEFAKCGADVAFTFRSSPEFAVSLEKEISELGRKSKSYQADAADGVKAIEVVESVIKEFGKIDILVNNAGITRDSLLMRMSEIDWDLVLDTNLKSVFHYTKIVSRQMMSQRSGKIINISSVVGISGSAGQANYVASKAGVIGFTKSIAKELASRNIQVNAVAPGFVDTEMTEKLTEKQKEIILTQIPMKRIAKTFEVAQVVSFLASSASDYMTGQVLAVDGGMTM